MIMTYNCADFLEKTLRLLPRELFDTIIIADDASTDNTLEVAKSLGIAAFTHPHGGYGGNLKFGLQKAVAMGADAVIEIHGDGQFVSSIPEAIQKLEQKYDLVLGNRFYKLLQPLKDRMSLVRYFGNLTLSLLGRIVLCIRPTDLFTGFRAYSKRLVESVDFSRGSDDYFYSFEIIALARYAKLKICQVPARCFYNQAHTSISLWKGFLEIGQTPFTLLLYVLARVGIRVGIFAPRKEATSKF